MIDVTVMLMTITMMTVKVERMDGYGENNNHNYYNTNSDRDDEDNNRDDDNNNSIIMDGV